MGRRYDHPKRQTTTAQIAYREMCERLASEISPVIDIAMTYLHDELVKWPDEWTLPGKCGAPDNPHQWHVLHIARWHYAKRLHIDLGEVTGMTLVNAGDAVCVCGLIESEHEQYLRDLEERSQLRFMLYGLTHRDVQ